MDEIWMIGVQFAAAISIGLLVWSSARWPRQLRVVLAGLALLMLAQAGVNGALAWRDHEGDARNWAVSDADQRRLVQIAAEIDSPTEDLGQIWQ